MVLPDPIDVRFTDILDRLALPGASGPAAKLAKRPEQPLKRLLQSADSRLKRSHRVGFADPDAGKSEMIWSSCAKLTMPSGHRGAEAHGTRETFFARAARSSTAIRVREVANRSLEQVF
jgi:hypothetical protein